MLQCCLSIDETRRRLTQLEYFQEYFTVINYVRGDDLFKAPQDPSKRSNFDWHSFSIMSTLFYF